MLNRKIRNKNLKIWEKLLRKAQGLLGRQGFWSAKCNSEVISAIKIFFDNAVKALLIISLPCANSSMSHQSCSLSCLAFKAVKGMATPCFHGNNFPLFFYVSYPLTKSILLLISNGSSITPLSCSYHTPRLSHTKIPSTLQGPMKMFPLHDIVFPCSPTWKKSYSATFIPLVTCLLTPYKILPLTTFFFWIQYLITS